MRTASATAAVSQQQLGQCTAFLLLAPLPRRYDVRAAAQGLQAGRQHMGSRRACERVRLFLCDITVSQRESEFLCVINHARTRPATRLRAHAHGISLPPHRMHPNSTRTHAGTRACTQHSRGQCTQHSRGQCACSEQRRRCRLRPPRCGAACRSVELEYSIHQHRARQHNTSTTPQQHDSTSTHDTHVTNRRTTCAPARRGRLVSDRANASAAAHRPCGGFRQG